MCGYKLAPVIGGLDTVGSGPELWIRKIASGRCAEGKTEASQVRKRRQTLTLEHQVVHSFCSILFEFGQDVRVSVHRQGNL
jgi:hypothetical protein